MFLFDEIVHRLEQIEATQRLILKAIRLLTKKEMENMSAVDDLKAAVTANTNAEQSAVTLINGLAQQLKDAVAAGDPAALSALATEIQNNSAALAAAVTANTPAASPQPAAQAKPA